MTPEHTSLPAAGAISTKNMRNSALPPQPQMSLDGNITVKGVSPVATPWAPGPEGLYSRPKGASASAAPLAQMRRRQRFLSGT